MIEKYSADGQLPFQPPDPLIGIYNSGTEISKFILMRRCPDIISRLNLFRGDFCKEPVLGCDLLPGSCGRDVHDWIQASSLA